MAGGGGQSGSKSYHGHNLRTIQRPHAEAIAPGSLEAPPAPLLSLLAGGANPAPSAQTNRGRLRMERPAAAAARRVGA